MSTQPSDELVVEEHSLVGFPGGDLFWFMFVGMVSGFYIGPSEVQCGDVDWVFLGDISFLAGKLGRVGEGPAETWDTAVDVNRCGQLRLEGKGSRGWRVLKKQ